MSTATLRFTPAEGWRYGLLGLPLAFVALPLYVLLPNHYARAFGMPLAALGAVLLAARLLDAFFDPWIGRVCDRFFACSPRAVLRLGAAAAAVLAAGFALLFFPPMRGQARYERANRAAMMTELPRSRIPLRFHDRKNERWRKI